MQTRKRSRQRKAMRLLIKIARRMNKELGVRIKDPFECRDKYQERFGTRSLTRRFDFCSIIM